MQDDKTKRMHEKSDILKINAILQRSRLIQLQDIARKLDALENINRRLAVENTNLQREIEKLGQKISSEVENRRT